MVSVPKAEAEARIAKHLAGLKRQLEDLRVLLRRRDRSEGYVLNFKVNALKKEIHRWQAHSARIHKDSRAEAVLPGSLGA
jgi:hypothetical protein